MNNNKGINIGLLLMAIILGITIIRHFNFQTYKFKMPVLDIIFLIAFIIAIILIIRDYLSRPKNK